MTTEIFDREQIISLLTELGADLDQRGLRAELFIVGGAAMALAYNTRRTTRDIDAVFEDKNEVYAAADRVGFRHGLSKGWLNDAVKGFLPGLDPNKHAVLSVPGVSVSVPSPEYLLALKVYAARVDRDPDDIRELARICGATTAEQVLSITERVMGGRKQLLPKAQFLVQELFPPAAPNVSLLTRLSLWLKNRREDRAARPPRSPKPFGAGRCGATTSRGGRCRNRRGSCPNHR